VRQCARAGKRALGQERKIVTAVFADLVGFMAQAEQLDPEDVRELLSSRTLTTG
jgi:class 3 adenylate cyclase